MKITLLDRSKYFRGLLLLLRKDKKVTDPEKAMMKHVASALGFNAEFCENAIHEVLTNIHISDEPPTFSSQGREMASGNRRHKRN